jgi:hypothetical protein
MSTETSATTRTKRVRLSLPTTVIPNATPRVTATEAAVTHLRSIAESLSRHAFQDIIVELGNDIILATSKVHHQQAVITASFDDDTRIPRSARVGQSASGRKPLRSYLAALTTRLSLLCNLPVLLCLNLI